MPRDEEAQNTLVRDFPREMLLGLLLILAISIYFLRDWLPHGTELWPAWILVGIGFLFLLDSVIRECSIRYRWSSHLRAIAGVTVLEIGIGLIYGFAQLIPYFVSTFVFAFLYTIKIREKLK